MLILLIDEIAELRRKIALNYRKKLIEPIEMGSFFFLIFPECF